jgi:hypothetical protein
VKVLLQAVAIGTAITLALFGLGYVAAEQGQESLSYVLYWQAYLLYQLLPCSVSLTPGESLCEDMTVAKATFYAGIPLGIAVYSATVYLLRRVVQGRSAHAQAASRAPDDLR